MLVLLSPAKKQDFSTSIEPKGQRLTQPLHKKEIQALMNPLKALNRSKIKQLMSISDSLADLNYERFQAFDPDTFTKGTSKPAAFAFKGDAYQTLEIESFSSESLAYAQTHLLILSGLYGALRPLDLIQAYRLEMSIKLKTAEHPDLYHFWEDRLHKTINAHLKKHPSDYVLNLASKEYSSAVSMDLLNKPVIHVDFKNKKNDTYKTIGILAKRARGLMTRYCCLNEVKTIKQLTAFRENGYRYSKAASSDDKMVFLAD